MFKTKKDVDKHVQKVFSNLRPHERDMRGMTIAKLYYKINEYQKAEEYLLAYLGVKEDNDQAHKLLAQCYKQMKKTEKALQYYQHALQLNPKQPDVLVEVCQLLLDDPSLNLKSAKYWCDLAESEKVSHDAVFSLRLKIVDKTETGSQPIEELIQKEIAARPHDVGVRISLLRSYVEQQRVEEAFKYAFKMELSQNEAFNSSADWYNVVWHVLSNFELAKYAKKDWDYWLLALVSLERQVSIVLNSLTGNVNDATNMLFKFDQYLFKFAQVAAGNEHLHDQRELVAFCQEHYRGQLLLHIVTLLFKREILQNKNKWKETVRNALPLLLLGFQIEAPDAHQHWLKHCNEQSKQLVQLWTRETAFRAAQLGRIMLSFIVEEENEEVAQFNQLAGNEHDGLWENNEELLSFLRQICADKQWRHNVFLSIFTNSEQKLKETTSIFITSSKLREPNYAFPKLATVEEYEEVAQQLHPQSLAHHVYLCLSNDNLADVRAHYFSGLNYSTQNLIFCGVESLSQLDVDSFMYAATIQAKRQLEVERDTFYSYNSGNRNAAAKPRMLPYALISTQLCTEEQTNWWHAAYTVYKNLSSHSNLFELRAQLQLGLEAVRGVNGPKANLYIVFKLGQILLARAQGLVKSVEKAALEARVEFLYKQGLAMLKKHQKNHLEPYGKYFKYAKSNLIAVEQAVNNAAEDAISYLSTRYFKKSLFEEFIEEVDELQLPTATYMQAEAYRKLDEASRTPRKTKRLYLERRNEYLQKTKQLLENNEGHQLSSLIAGEIQRLHQDSNNLGGGKGSSKYQHNQHSIDDTFAGSPRDFHNNSSNYEDAEEELFAESNTVSTAVSNRSRRETSTTAAIFAAAVAANANAPHNLEMENLVKQMATTLSFVKEEIVDNIKPEVLSMRKEISSLKDKVSQLEDTLKKTRIASETPSRDDASQVLDDICLIEDVLKNQLYQGQSGSQQAQPQPTTPHFPTIFNGAAATGGSPLMPPGPLQQQASHMQQQQQRFFSPMPSFNNQMFPPSPNPLNYYAPQQSYMMPPQGPGVPPNNILGPRNSNFPLNIYAPQAAPFMDAAGGLSFSLPQQLAASQLAAQATMAQLLPPQPTPAPLAGAVVSALPITTTTALAAPAASIVVPSSTAMPAVPPPAAISAPTMFNKALNNQPVEKGPPANVVITSSDPLPKAALASSVHTAVQQPTLSVTIPPQHIKPSLVQTSEVAVTAAALTGATSTTSSIGAFSFNLSGNNTSATSTNAFMGFGNTTSSTAAPVSAGSSLGTTIFGSSTFSFKPQIAQAAAEKAKLEQSGGDSNVLNMSGNAGDFSKSFGTESEPEYDPRPDFQPIIPLPDEVEVKTGEEDETVMFCYLAKLYRHVANEWKERGKGEIKILKNKEGYSRVLMRREQTHKICANHKITSELKLCKVDKEEKSFIWAANDFADEELHLEKFFVRFKLPDTAQKFKTAFENAKKEAAELDKKQNENDKDIPKVGFALSKSNALNSFATSTPSSNKSEGGATGAVGLLANPKAKPLVNIAATLPSVSAAATPTMQKTLFGNIAQTKDESRKQTTTITTSMATATDVSKQPTTTAAASPFANFTFGSNTAVTFTVANTPTKPTAAPAFSLFGNVNKGNQSVTPFGVASGAGGDASTPFSTPLGKPTAGAAADKSATCEVDEDDYVPTAEFKPVISLPELVEVNTGEENELVLFEHRAKLLRFVKETSEWKERGLGNIKLLQANNDINQVRLLMRREQVLKLCCNQRIAKDTKFNYAKNSRSALTWAGQDYSEETLNTEMLCVRFKTEVICQQFLDAVHKAQTAMCADSAADAIEKKTSEVKQKDIIAESKENLPVCIDTLLKGFGDAFKPKTGSWSCNACYISNAVDQLYCIACNTPKDDTLPKKEPPSAHNLTCSLVTNKFNFGFGGDGGGGGDSSAGTTTNKPAFTFGAPAPSPLAAALAKSSSSSSSSSITSQLTSVPNTAAGAANPNPSPLPTNTKSGFGDAFKPKAGSWSCQSCYLSNAAGVLYCSACEAPKDDTVPKKDNNQGVLSLTASSAGAPKFNFGFNTAAASGGPAANATPNAFTFDPNAGDTKSERVKNLFGGSVAGTKSSDTFSFAQPTATSTTLSEAGDGQNPVANAFNFSLTQKPPTQGVPTQFSIDKKDFNFTLKPKSPGRGQKTPPKSAAGRNDDDDAGDDDYHEEEENNTYFIPVIPLPDKIDVRTGEENEELLYVHRAKLFRLVDNEWKERGLGDVKILRHRQTRKLRVVMRRELVLKICLNHVLNESVGYKPKDDKSWLFIVHDYSEGESMLERFTLRFKNAEIANGFLSAVKKALDGSAQPIIDETPGVSEEIMPSLPHTAVSQPISDEIRLKAEKLMLPYEFLIANGNCEGCCGCDPDSYVFQTPKSLEPFYNSEDDGIPPFPMYQPAMTLPSSATITPAANRTIIKPANMSLSTLSTNGSAGTAINATPFDTAATMANTPTTAGSDVTFSFKAAFDSSNKANANEINSTPATGGFVFGGGGDKNIVFGQTPSIFSESNMTKSIFGGSSNNSDSVNPIKSIFGGSSTNTENKANAIFSSAPSSWSAKPISGGCLFGNSTIDTSSTEGTIFGGTSSNVPVSMGGSLFGGALSKPESGDTPVFGKSMFNLGSTNTTSDAAGDNFGKSLFGLKSTDSSQTSFADLSNAAKATPNKTTTGNSVFGLGGEAPFGSASPFNKSVNVTDSADKKEAPISFSDLCPKATNDFSALAAKAAASDDFASLAAKATDNGSGTHNPFQKSPGGFIGLTHQDAFQSFLKPNNADNSPQTNAGNNDGGEVNDENYDPHYDPIIPLPEEIVVTTGEEDETKLFGERAMLYRWNSDTKEWKERGVGELKILLHPVKQTYRMLMRREQIHKCVLNHGIGADFSFSNMNNNPKSFIWGTMNYAESNTGELERLAVRFKKQDIGDAFRKTLEECIDAAKKRQQNNI